MNKIVFITGAGFSRPHGLPLMSDFYEISRDIYEANPKKYAHFQEVFDIIKKLHYVKSYYSSDLFNIEEILSILEMWQEAGGKELEKPFKNYIEDVIEVSTKDLLYPESFPGNWEEYIFPRKYGWHLYGFFALQFFPIQIKSKVENDYGQQKRKFYGSFKDSDLQQHSIITLNYDLLLEKICGYVNDNFDLDKKIQFSRFKDNSNSEPYYSKLHGSIGDNDIIPPTWNKGINKSIRKSWQLAHHLLESANKIVILGYSLPKTDSYIRYLLKSSILDNANLKTIDIITKDDPKRETQNRYEDFIKFKNFRFVNGDIQSYLSQLFNKETEKIRGDGKGKILTFNSLEEVHEEFMKANAS